MIRLTPDATKKVSCTRLQRETEPTTSESLVAGAAQAKSPKDEILDILDNANAKSWKRDLEAIRTLVSKL